MTKTQTSDILQHLKQGRRLTQKEAINEYGAYRLSSIIYSLRKQGHMIESKQLDVPTRYKKTDGTTKNANIVEYKIIKGNKKGFASRINTFINSILQ
tara:strand:- start:2399 stop:2689 length:291 start_codon:yes stop_codon:yes gene_type:complete